MHQFKHLSTSHSIMLLPRLINDCMVILLCIHRVLYVEMNLTILLTVLFIKVQ